MAQGVCVQPIACVAASGVPLQLMQQLLRHLSVVPAAAGSPEGLSMVEAEHTLALLNEYLVRVRPTCMASHDQVLCAA
jgi:hypothetical protein